MGTILLEVVTADPEGLLSRMSDLGFNISNVKISAPLTIRFNVLYSEKNRIVTFLKRTQVKWQIISDNSVHLKVSRLLKRPVLLVGLIFLLFLTFYIPSRILFVRVYGNQDIPAKLIIEQTSDLGLGFGDSRREVRSEEIKNHLLSRIPQLQWVGVNTYGCVAEVHVRERKDTSKEEHGDAVSSIVAARDGIIQNITVTQGNAQCSPGQAVKQGQTLISGYSDLGLVLKGTRAEGEVFGLTQREIHTVTLAQGVFRGTVIRTEKKYSVEIGKKRINFYKGSGISPATCVKMYSEKTVTAPGEFSFPIKLIEETWIYYEPTPQVSAQSDLHSWLCQAGRSYALEQMIAGQIINSQESVDIGEDLCYYYGKYTCLEMIGQVKKEEFKGLNG